MSDYWNSGHINGSRRGFVEWNTDKVPDTAVIQDVLWAFDYWDNTSPAIKVTSSGNSPSSMDGEDFYTVLDPILYQHSGAEGSEYNYFDLYSGASEDLENNLVDDWFGFIIQSDKSVYINPTFSEDNPQYLVIRYLPNFDTSSSDYYYSCQGERITPGVALMTPGTSTETGVRLKRTSEYEYEIVLLSRPTNEVTINLDASRQTESVNGVLDEIYLPVQASSIPGINLVPATLEFDSSNWSIPQTVVIGIESIASVGSYEITHEVLSSDEWYDNYTIENFPVYVVASSGGGGSSDPTPTPTAISTPTSVPTPVVTANPTSVYNLGATVIPSPTPSLSNVVTPTATRSVEENLTEIPTPTISDGFEVSNGDVKSISTQGYYYICIYLLIAFLLFILVVFVLTRRKRSEDSQVS